VRVSKEFTVSESSPIRCWHFREVEGCEADSTSNPAEIGAVEHLDPPFGLFAREPLSARRLGMALMFSGCGPILEIGDCWGQVVEDEDRGVLCSEYRRCVAFADLAQMTALRRFVCAAAYDAGLSVRAMAGRGRLETMLALSDTSKVIDGMNSTAITDLARAESARYEAHLASARRHGRFADYAAAWMSHRAISLLVPVLPWEVLRTALIDLRHSFIHPFYTERDAEALILRELGLADEAVFRVLGEESP